MPKIITLVNGGQTIVDDRFYDYLNQFKWYKHSRNNSVCRYEEDENRKTITIWMAREIAEIIGLDLSNDIDHKDRNKFNNLAINLRSATRTQNNQNIGLRKDNTSGYKGVSYHKEYNKWTARIKVNGIYKNLGYYFNAEAAAIDYDLHAKLYFKEFAVLNFPDKVY